MSAASRARRAAVVSLLLAAPAANAAEAAPPAALPPAPVEAKPPPAELPAPPPAAPAAELPAPPPLPPPPAAATAPAAAAAPAAAPAADADAAADAAPVADADAAPAAAPAAVAAPAPAKPDPFLSTRAAGHLFAASATLGARYEAAGALPTDATAAEYAPTPALDTLVRAGLRYDSDKALLPFLLSLEAEGEALSGVQSGGESELDAVGLHPEARDPVLRKAFAKLSFANFATIGGGLTTSHVGLGLMANDGAHGWEPGSARFLDPRGGDRVLRFLVATGPWTDARLVIAGGFDPEVHDDVTLEGDTASQAFGTIQVGAGRPTNAGLYVVARSQESEDGKTLEVTAIDLNGQWTHELGADHKLVLAAEGALVTGETSLGPSVDFPTHEVLQLGGTLRGVLSMGLLGGALDVLYASGDQNLDDGATNAFKADPNFDAGLLLYRHVLAAQSGRAPITAADPELVGLPSEDLDRLPSRGSMTNTIAFFPRVVITPLQGLECYGGPLLALSEVPLVDAKNTRFAGGDPRNALDGASGRYLGTELDGGVSYFRDLSGVKLRAALEAGLFLPGAAFTTADGGSMDSVGGGRLLVRAEL